MPNSDFVSVEFDISNVYKQFGELPAAVETKVVRIALRKCTVPLVKNAKASAPVASGVMQANIRAIVVKAKKDGNIIAYVGIPRKMTTLQKATLKNVRRSFYGNGKQLKLKDVENKKGLRPFWILFNEFGFVDRHGVHHPGTRFLAKATAATESQIVKIFEEVFTLEFESLVTSQTMKYGNPDK